MKVEGERSSFFKIFSHAEGQVEAARERERERESKLYCMTIVVICENLPTAEWCEIIKLRIATSSLSGLVGVAKLNSAFRNGFGGNSSAYYTNITSS
jgi:hypothetical protein